MERNMKNKLKVGDFVKSNFRARWAGVVVDVEIRTGIEPLVTVCVFLSRYGRRLRKTQKHTLSGGWLEKIKKPVA
jgi:hypothetical protein